MNRRVHRFAHIGFGDCSKNPKEYWDSDWGEDVTGIGVIIKNIKSEQERLKKLNSKIDNSYPSAVYFDDRRGRYVRLYRDRERSRFIKHKNNKRVRRYQGEIRNGNHYRKISEFWWEYC